MVIVGELDESAITHAFIKPLCASVTGADFEGYRDISRHRRASFQPEQELASDAGAPAVGGDGKKVEMRDAIAIFHDAKTGEPMVEPGDEHVGIVGVDACDYPLLRPAPVQAVLDRFSRHVGDRLRVRSARQAQS